MGLKSKTPEKAAEELGRWLETKGAKPIVQGSTVICEGFTFEWPIALNGGACPFAWEMGDYSKPGPFPDGVSNAHVFGESDNHYSMTFWKA